MGIWMNGECLMKHHCLRKKKEFHINLNMEDIADADYVHA